MLQQSELCAHQYPEAESEDIIRFDKSLKELRDLRSQIHYAADFCESNFLKAKQKKMVMESTKEYICRAVVTFVDHLGSVSANLNYCISKTTEILEAELRMDSLRQRLLSCQQYAHKLSLTKLQWSTKLARHHSRYLSAVPNVEEPNEVLWNSDVPTSVSIRGKHEFDTKEEVPLFLYTYTHKPSLAKNLVSGTAVEKVLPVSDGLPVISKAPNPIFHFQSTQKLGRNTLTRRRSMKGTDILSLIRRSKRTR